MNFNYKETQDFLTGIYTNLDGYLNVASHGNWIGCCFSTTPGGIAAAIAYAAALDRDQPQGIYVRTTTLTAAPPPGQRGLSEDTALVPFLWADIDYGTKGHATPAGLPLPPSQSDAERLIKEAGLPDPTVLIHSGGGLYPLWVFPEPLTDLDRAAAMSEAVQHALFDASREHGWHYGTGVGDLARVIRLPGTVNRKIPGEPRLCRVIGGTGLPVSVDSLPVAVPPPAPANRSASSSDGGVFDALASTAAWSDLLEPAEWSFVATESDGAELWLRPGDPSSAYSARCGRGGTPTMVVHSEAAGLPSGAGQRLTMGRVFAHLNHDGDESAAARDLLNAAFGVGGTEAARGLPEHVLAAIRTWAGTAPRVYGRPSKANLAAMVDRVLTADADDKWKLLRWLNRRLAEHVNAGHLTPVAAEGIARDTGKAVGLVPS